jgi:hypothetical protein
LPVSLRASAEALAKAGGTAQRLTRRFDRLGSVLSVSIGLIPLSGTKRQSIWMDHHAQPQFIKT